MSWQQQNTQSGQTPSATPSYGSYPQSTYAQQTPQAYQPVSGFQYASQTGVQWPPGYMPQQTAPPAYQQPQYPVSQPPYAPQTGARTSTSYVQQQPSYTSSYTPTATTSSVPSYPSSNRSSANLSGPGYSTVADPVTGDVCWDYKKSTTVMHEEHLVATDSDSLEEKLYNLQLIFLVDISGSMQEKDTDPEGTGTRGMLGPFWTRYDNMVKLLKNMVTQLWQYDSNGEIPCYFFNDKVECEVFKDPKKLLATVRTHKPSGTTALGDALYRAAAENLNDKENFLFIVFTDGVPNNVDQVFQFLEHEIYWKDRTGDRLNVLFVRFGNDRGAIHFLSDLDDHALFGGNVDMKSAAAAYYLGPKLLVLNGIFEHLEEIPEFKTELDKRP